MSSKVVFRRIAKLELDDAISWYEDRRRGLGHEFSVAIEQQIEKIVLTPNQFGRIRGPVRRALLRRFPYFIYFIAESERIVILAIFHVKRGPEKLEARF